MKNSKAGVDTFTPASFSADGGQRIHRLRPCTSAFHAAADLVRMDGVLALYRGFTPFVVRLGPVFVISLPLTEQIRRLAGLGYL